MLQERRPLQEELVLLAQRAQMEEIHLAQQSPERLVSPERPEELVELLLPEVLLDTIMRS